MWRGARWHSFLVGVAIVIPATLIVLWFLYNPHRLTTEEAISELVVFSALVLALAAASGFAAMATIEMMKRLLHLRGSFFRAELLKEGPEVLESLLPRRWNDRPQYWRSAERLDVPLEQLIAQISHAVDGALEMHTGNVPAPDFAFHRSRPLLVSLLRTRVPELEERLSFGPGGSTFLRAETQAALDELQIRMGNAWRWRLRVWSCLLAAFFTTVALVYVPGPPGAKVAALAASAVFGGFFAGFFRDLVEVVERGRRT